MTSNQMSTSAQIGEVMYERATNDSIKDTIESYGGRENAAKAVADFSQGEIDDVLAYFEFNGF